MQVKTMAGTPSAATARVVEIYQATLGPTGTTTLLLDNPLGTQQMNMVMDYDGDGNVDVFIPNGKWIPKKDGVDWVMDGICVVANENFRNRCVEEPVRTAKPEEQAVFQEKFARGREAAKGMVALFTAALNGNTLKTIPLYGLTDHPMMGFTAAGRNVGVGVGFGFPTDEKGGDCFDLGVETCQFRSVTLFSMGSDMLRVQITDPALLNQSALKAAYKKPKDQTASSPQAAKTK